MNCESIHNNFNSFALCYDKKNSHSQFTVFNIANSALNASHNIINLILTWMVTLKQPSSFVFLLIAVVNVI